MAAQETGESIGHVTLGIDDIGRQRQGQHWGSGEGVHTYRPIVDGQPRDAWQTSTNGAIAANRAERAYEGRGGRQR